jgi:two-component system, NarL family, response regulator NreC
MLPPFRTLRERYGSIFRPQNRLLDRRPDLVLTEIYLPDCTGVELTRRLLKSRPGLRVLAFTGVEDPAAMEAMLGAHAAGYVLKRCSRAELLDAIRSVHAGERYCDPGLAGQVLGGATSRDGAPSKHRTTPLSDREMSVLRLIAWGYTSKETAARLRLSVKTVETYRARFQRKLGIDSRPALVRYALLQGWLKER